MRQRVKEDDLVIRYWDSETRLMSYHGKRVGKDKLDLMTREEIRAYVTKGGPAAVKMIRERTCLSIRECMDILNTTKGKERIL